MHKVTLGVALARHPKGPGSSSVSGRRPANKADHQVRQEHEQAFARRRLRRQRQVIAIHGLGARVVFELLDELDRRYGLGEGLDLRFLRAVGGDRFPAAPPPRLVKF